MVRQRKAQSETPVGVTHATVPLDALRPHPRNYRGHPDSQIGRLAASLARFGQVRSIVVQQGADGRYLIVAGHGLAEAAKREGLTELHADVIPAHWTDAEVTGYLIADNESSRAAEDDLTALAAMLDEQRNAGYHLESLGFSDDELAALLDQLADEQLAQGGGHDVDDPDGGGDDFDTTPDEGPTRCQPGDLWQLGNHRLLVGDSTKREDVARLMDGKRVPLCFTSPPYSQQRAYDGGIGAWDELMRGVFALVPGTEDVQVLVNLGMVHRDGEWQPYWEHWLAWMRQEGWRRFGWYVWDQGAGLPGDWSGRLAPSHEFVFHFNRTARHPNKTKESKYAGEQGHGTGLRRADGSMSGWSGGTTPVQPFKIPDSVIRVTRHMARGIEVEHPAVFPVQLCVEMYSAYSDEGDAVYEPFAGSGTALIAAERIERRCYAMEISPRYCDVILRRWEAETGRDAVLLERLTTSEPTEAAL